MPKMYYRFTEKVLSFLLKSTIVFYKSKYQDKRKVLFRQDKSSIIPCRCKVFSLPL